MRIVIHAWQGAAIWKEKQIQGRYRMGRGGLGGGRIGLEGKGEDGKEEEGVMG